MNSLTGALRRVERLGDPYIRTTAAPPLETLIKGPVLRNGKPWSPGVYIGGTRLLAGKLVSWSYILGPPTWTVCPGAPNHIGGPV